MAHLKAEMKQQTDISTQIFLALINSIDRIDYEVLANMFDGLSFPTSIPSPKATSTPFLSSHTSLYVTIRESSHAFCTLL